MLTFASLRTAVSLPGISLSANASSAAAVRNYATIRKLPRFIQKEMKRQKQLEKDQAKADELEAPLHAVPSTQGTVMRRAKVKQLRPREIKRGNPRHGDPNRPPKGLPKVGDPTLSRRIMFPNVPLTLVRNAPTPSGVYDPWLATFRCAPQLTKSDIISYLRNIYNLKITYINTLITPRKIVLSSAGKYIRTSNYKKVLVGLEEPFWYPDERDDAWMEDNYQMMSQVVESEKLLARQGSDEFGGIDKLPKDHQGDFIVPRRMKTPRHRYETQRFNAHQRWKLIAEKIHLDSARSTSLLKEETDKVSSNIPSA